MGLFETALKIGKILLLLFLAVLLMLNVFAYISLSTFMDVFIEPKTWTNAMAKQNISESLHGTILDLLIMQSPIGAPGSGQNATTKEEIKQTLGKTFTKTWIEKNLNDTVTDLFLYLKGQKDHFYGEISVAELKPGLVNTTTNMMSSQIDLMIDEQLSKPYDVPGMPCKTMKECVFYCEYSASVECDIFSSQLNLMMTGRNSTERLTMDSIKAKAKEMFTQNAGTELTAIPDSIKLIEPGSAQEEGLKKAKEVVGIASLASTALFIVCFGIMIAITLLTFSIKNAFRWIGVPLLIIGAIMLVVSFATPPLLKGQIDDALGKLNIAKNLPTFDLFTKLISVVKGIIYEILENFLFIARIKYVIVCVLGAGMVGGSFFLK